MIAPGLPANEVERLAALRGLRVLDTLPEEAWDDITLIAAHVCRVPIALVSLVDEAGFDLFARRVPRARATLLSLKTASEADLRACVGTVEDVLELHGLQMERYGGAGGLRDRGLLESAVAQPAANPAA